MKHTKDIDFFLRFELICNPVMPIEQYPNFLNLYEFVPVADAWEFFQNLNPFVDTFDDIARSGRAIIGNNS